MEEYKEIERSIIKKYRKEIWSKFVSAVKDYKLINENDNINNERMLTLNQNFLQKRKNIFNSINKNKNSFLYLLTFI